MNLPSQVDISKIQKRVIAMIHEASQYGQPEISRNILKKIIFGLNQINNLLKNDVIDLDEIYCCSSAIGQLFLHEGGQYIDRTHFGKDFGDFVSDLGLMLRIQTALNIIKEIMKNEESNIMAEDIYDILTKVLDSFSIDGRRNFKYFLEQRLEISIIRSRLGSVISADYQKIFKELMY